MPGRGSSAMDRGGGGGAPACKGRRSWAGELQWEVGILFPGSVRGRGRP